MPIYLNGKKVSPLKNYKPKNIENYEIYSGPYSVDPLTTSSTTLLTAQKILEHNVVIQQIRYQEVSNNSGGSTAYIGI